MALTLKRKDIELVHIEDGYYEPRIITETKPLLLEPIWYVFHYVKKTGKYLMRPAEKGELAVAVPDKVYGDGHKIVHRVITSYKRFPKGSGLIVYGEKGNGKTIQMNMIAKEALKNKLPCIYVGVLENEKGDVIMDEVVKAFSLLPECLVFIDEFTNKIGKYSQRELLTFLDGALSTKSIMLISTNEKHGLTEYILERPTRIRYIESYDTIPDAIIRDFMNAKMKDHPYRESLETTIKASPKLNMDSLIAIVDEIELFPELEYTEIISILNAAIAMGAKWKVNKIEFDNGFKVFNPRLKELRGNNFKVDFEYVIEGVKKIPNDIYIGPQVFDKYDDGNYIYITPFHYIDPETNNREKTQIKVYLKKLPKDEILI